tara:strand:- start:286 stop:624 length:339 start_codon:yes stop_codon:yes gene_type:complete
MEILANIISFLFILLGSILILIGSIGLLRLPDVFSRIHAVGMIDTAGIGFIIFGLLIYSGFTIVSIKLLILGCVLIFTSPIAGHAVAISAKKTGLKPFQKIATYHKNGETND